MLQGSYHGLQYDEQKEIGHRLCMHVYVRGEGLGGLGILRVTTCYKFIGSTCDYISYTKVQAVRRSIT